MHQDDFHDRVVLALDKVAASLDKIAADTDKRVSIEGEVRDILNQLLDAFRQFINPQPPVPTGLSVTEEAVQTSQGAVMKTSGHSVKLQILPTGQVIFTFTPTPAGSTMPAGTPPLSYTVSDPALVVVADPGNPNATPPRPPDNGSGLVALGTPNPPANTPNWPGVTGIVVTGQTTLPGASAPIVSDPASVDVIPAPPTPTNPTGFAVAETAL
jgi:hypothetical protein